MRVFIVFIFSSIFVCGNTQSLDTTLMTIVSPSNNFISVDSIIEMDTIVQYINSNSLYKHWYTQKIVYRTDNFKHSFDSIPIILTDTANGINYCHPFNGNITSHFGYRRYRQHYGTDIDLVTGDSVRAAFNGKVRVTKYNKSFGKIVVIRHDNELETVYAHLSKILVDSNQILKAGDVIGLGGNTGRSTGSHLHYEVRYMGRALDAENIIDFKKGELINDTIIISEASFDYLKRIANSKNAKYHYIRKGDTLYGIACKYHIKVNNICYYNGINQSAILQIGQKLRIR